MGIQIFTAATSPLGLGSHRSKYVLEPSVRTEGREPEGSDKNRRSNFVKLNACPTSDGEADSCVGAPDPEITVCFCWANLSEAGMSWEGAWGLGVGRQLRSAKCCRIRTFMRSWRLVVSRLNFYAEAHSTALFFWSLDIRYAYTDSQGSPCWSPIDNADKIRPCLNPTFLDAAAFPFEADPVLAVPGVVSKPCYKKNGGACFSSRWAAAVSTQCTVSWSTKDGVLWRLLWGRPWR